ncbi:hypothetical protein BX57_26485 [Escherichia coli O26:H11 str. 2010C-3902]|nr:hypothetical protein BW87_19720 [Escherichia coli O145:NM str. 06-3484]EZH06215.1 hypothetical protein BX15_02645 [Escherichia coli O26:H11 str. 2009C-3689]EZH57124.1 hypothetical protein BX57_26485 [Escherichia coli O26:H11 str. 2010C-3902]KDM73398.1 hypothetical protein DA88_08745 [Escherichia coli]
MPLKWIILRSLKMWQRRPLTLWLTESVLLMLIRWNSPRSCVTRDSVVLRGMIQKCRPVLLVATRRRRKNWCVPRWLKVMPVRQHRS